jgi:hypothetical protein
MKYKDEVSDARGPGAPEKLGFDPARSIMLVERGFCARLAELGAEGRLPLDAHECGSRIRERLDELEHRVAPLIANELDRANLRFTTLAAAGFGVLASLCGAEQAAELVDDCLNTPLRARVLEGTRQMLDASDDPLAALVVTSKDREASFFGPSFSFARPVDDPDSACASCARSASAD